MNALVVIDALTPAVYSEPGGIDALISKLESDVRSVDTDISTPAGRAAVKSLAFKVTRSKTALDDMGKNLVADLKKQTGAVDVERRKIRERLDALADEVRKPLTDWENIEKDRVAGHEAAIAAMTALSIETSANNSPANIQTNIDRLAALNDREWQEFAKHATATHATVFADLERKRAASIKREADAAELVRLRAEQAAREQRDREARIAEEAAAKATRDAEAKAARDAQEAAERAAEEQRKAAKERADAVARAEKAERDATAAALKADHDFAAAAAKAEQDKKDAAAKAARDRKAAAEKAEAARLAAISAERKRVADAEAKVKAETERRERDEQHKIKVHTLAAAALMNAGLSKDDAKAAVTAIANGEVPNARISY